jgi:hypothetical protein
VLQERVRRRAYFPSGDHALLHLTSSSADLCLLRVAKGGISLRKKLIFLSNIIREKDKISFKWL